MPYYHPQPFQNMAAFAQAMPVNKSKVGFVFLMICWVALLIVVILIAVAPDAMNLNDDTKAWGLGVSLVALSIITICTGVAGYKAYKK